MSRRESKLDAAHRLGLDSHIVSDDLNDLSRNRRRLWGITLAIVAAVVLVSLVLAYAGMEQFVLTFVTSHIFNVIAAVVGVAFLSIQVALKLEYSHRS